MAKTNKAKILELCNTINKKSGDGTLYQLGSKHEVLNVPRWSTGIQDLDNIIGGGIPEGRVIEISGAESSGKTTLLHHLHSLHEMCLHMPVEGTFDASRARAFGNDKNLNIFRASCGEDAMNQTLLFAQAGMPLITIDSVPSLVPRDDMEKVNKGASKNTVEEQRLGGIARLLTKMLPSIEDACAITGTTVIFTNQLRDKMNAQPFGEKTQTTGGHKLKHACSIRLQIARKKWIEIPNNNPSNSAQMEKVGLIMKVKVAKSKVCNPFGECELPLFFHCGFVSFDEVPSIRADLMKTSKEFWKKNKVIPMSTLEEEEADEWDGMSEDDDNERTTFWREDEENEDDWSE